MKSIFSLPKNIVAVLAFPQSRSALSAAVFAVTYMALGALGLVAQESKSLYDYPLLDLLTVGFIFLLVSIAQKVVGSSPSRPVLATLMTWLFSSALGLFLAEQSIAVFTRVPIPETRQASYFSDCLVLFVNLATYCIIVSSFVRYRSSLKALMVERERLSHLREHLDRQLDQVRLDYSEEVRQKVQPALIQISDALQSQNAEALMSHARIALERVVLPLNRAFEQSDPGRLPKFPEVPSGARLRLQLSGLADFRFQLSNSAIPLVSVLVGTVTLLGAFIYIFDQAGLNAGLAALASTFVLQSIQALSFRKILVNPWAAALLIVSFSLLSSLIAIGVSTVFVGSARIGELAFLLLGLFLVQASLGMYQLFISVSDSHLIRQRQVGDQFATMLDRRNAEIRQLRKRISQSVHSDVQGKLRAILLRVKLGVLDENTFAELTQDLEHISLVLNQLGSRQVHDFNAALAGIVEFWSGIVSFEVRVDSKAESLLEEKQSINEDLVEVIAEAVANAVKHAEANHIEISLSATDKHFQIKVANKLNQGVEAFGSSGLGSKVFDLLCVEWSLQPQGQMMVFSGSISHGFERQIDS